MSSGDETSTGPLTSRSRSSKRGSTRNGTFIIPGTGERSRRQFTLRPSRLLSSTNNTSDDDSIDHTESLRAYLRIVGRRAGDKLKALWSFLNSDDGHGVLKCTFAYLLGSSGTLFPPLSNFLGHRDGKHITATLTVYFHPARTVGSMLEAVAIAIVAVLYAEILCLLSMATSTLFQRTLGLVEWAHLIVLVVFVGGGLGFVGWVKQRLNNPLVNVGTTLTSIAIISIITKEDAIYNGFLSWEKVVQMLEMLVIGISFTVAVNFLIWPISARRVLRMNMIKCTTALSDKLSLIGSAFLNGSEEEMDSTRYTQVSTQYNAALAQMSKMLREAKFEHYFYGNEKLYPLDKRLVKSIEAVSSAVGGLRSALDMQFMLLRESRIKEEEIERANNKNHGGERPSMLRHRSAFVDDTGESLTVIDETNEDELDYQPRPVSHTRSESDLTRFHKLQVPSDIFAIFISLLGPPMKSLAYTLSETLRESPFGADPQKHVKLNEQFRDSLKDALSLYDAARANALQELYRNIELGRSRTEETQADIEEVAASCGHFSFSLQAVALEMDSYLDAIEDLQVTTDAGIRSWHWLRFWRIIRPSKDSEPVMLDNLEREQLIQQQQTPPVRRLKNSEIPKGIPKTMVHRRDTFSWEAAPDTSQFVRKFSQGLLAFMRFLTRDDMLFGIKVGIGAILWAQFAFIPSTRSVYNTWRGEWGLLSFMIVAGMTTGAANTTGNARFLGTLIGACCACVSWLVSQQNPWVLALMGGIIALWNFYLIVVVKNGPLGRITLLAYNVITLYAYALSQQVDDDDDDEGGAHPLIFEITYHRVISVTLGILWGIMVCRLLWPISGRRKFREGLSVLYLQLGMIWKRGPLVVLYDSDSSLDYMREGEQDALQRYAFKLETLRGQAQSEFELRGPFPHEAYGRIMRSTRHILDGFYAMRLITHQRGALSPGERAILKFTATERTLLRQRICQVFQVLASCIMLEYPLTDAIPTIDSNKDRLLGKIYQFRKEHSIDMGLMSSSTRDGTISGHAAGNGSKQAEVVVVAEERDYALVYAYTLVTTQVAEELKKVRREVESLFGVLHEEALLLE